ncbi:hypothetical protein PIB30_041201 [Stylosanthes scabra]|uniref:RING-type E3 ubiquitin transferase n=1 Tax=Stylosanthes scabra TaxID=79078 RepID=A0ABU6ZDK1_9FABA|nr:hypothetical protein [Stylosanthes scabra]
MASQPDVSEISSLFERLVRSREMTLFLPFLFGFSDSQSHSSSQNDEAGERTTDGPNRERIILVNPFTQSMVVIDGSSSLEALFREIAANNGGKGGRPPATKESIDAMPSFEIKEGEFEGGECVVCLEDFGVGALVKEMPCKHRFHPNCIEKWLGIHGSCPVCRYEMPVEEKDVGKKRESEQEEEEEEERGERERRRIGNGEVWVSFSFNRGISRRNSHDQDQPQNQDQNQNQDSSSGGGDDERNSGDSGRVDVEAEN